MSKRKRGTERERLLRIITHCLLVERRSSDPFEVEVKEVLNVLRRYLPNWKVLEDFTLDAEALNRIASIIRLQGDWIMNRSTSLYVDPLLIELKLKIVDAERLIKIFSKSWHPIIEMEGLSKRRVGEATDYWNQLLPLEDRGLKLPTPSTDFGSTTLENLIRLKIMSDTSFNETLESFWQELRTRAIEKERVSYWSFIIADTYEDTIYRAYLTSFLVTYGYADMEINPIEEEAYLIPHEEPKVKVLTKQSISIPIAIDRDLWKSKKEGDE